MWAANHHSWWDGFVALAVLTRAGRPPALLMDRENLARFAFLQHAGVVAADRPRQALDALRSNRVLVVFPEGELRPPGPLGRVALGAAWLAERAPAAVLPVAVRIVIRGHQHPEAFVDIGSPCEPGELAEALNHRLTELDGELAATDPRQPVAGFHQVVAGRVSWDERISAWSDRIRR